MCRTPERSKIQGLLILWRTPAEGFGAYYCCPGLQKAKGLQAYYFSRGLQGAKGFKAYYCCPGLQTGKGLQAYYSSGGVQLRVSGLLLLLSRITSLVGPNRRGNFARLRPAITFAIKGMLEKVIFVEIHLRLPRWLGPTGEVIF